MSEMLFREQINALGDDLTEAEKEIREDLRDLSRAVREAAERLFLGLRYLAGAIVLHGLLHGRGFH